jgi:hypothetical protein
MPQAAILAKDNLVINFVGGVTKIVPRTSGIFNQVMDLIKSKAADQVFLDLIDIGSRLKLHTSGQFSLDNGNVYVGTERLPDSLGARVLDFADNGFDFAPLLKFWENCKLNPDPVAKTDLYAFLEHNGHPITDDGCFIAYRYCDSNFKAVHASPDGTHMDNSVGTVVKMNRADCDSDRNQTCSRGLHCAAFDYANGNVGGGYLLEVKVNPRDVVAIPVDYNGQKMRVCEFYVAAVNERTPIKRALYDQTDSTPEADESGAVTSKATAPVNTKVSLTDAWKTQPRKKNGQFARRK